MRWHVVHSRPGTVQEALDIATELEAFQVSERQRNRVNRHSAYAVSSHVVEKQGTSIESTLIDILQEIKRDREEQKQLLQEFVRRMTDFSGTDTRMGAVKIDVGIAVSLAMCHANVEDVFLSLVATTREMETG